MARMGKPRTHGRLTVNPELFKRGGRYKEGYIALRDIPEFGIKAGQEVSRRKGIEISQGGRRLEELVEYKGFRVKILRATWERVHGNLEGFNAFLARMNRAHRLDAPGLPIGSAYDKAKKGWTKLLQDAGLWEEFQDNPYYEEFWGSDPVVVDDAGLQEWSSEGGEFIPPAGDFGEF